MNTKKLFNNIIKIVLPLLLGSAILYWMYRGFDFSSISHVLLHEMNWTWMIISLPFGILAQAFRGWRWRQSLEPIGEHARSSVCVNSIFLSYAVSLLIPRIGEFARCGVLNRYDKVAFPKAIGTVVTERAVDTLIVILITSIAFVMQIGVFSNFFSRTGTRIDDLLGMFSATGWLVTAVCGVASLILFYYVLRHLSIYNKVKEMLSGIWQGISSLRKVKNIPLFLFYSIAIWGSYFLHYYLTFYCCHRADTERSRTVAFCRQDDAHPLWRGGQPGIVFCPDRAYSPDVAGCPSWRICVDCIEFYPYTRLTGETDRAYPASRRIKYQNNERKEQINNP